MDNDDLDRRFMAALRENGLTNDEINVILDAPENLQVPHHVVTDIGTHVVKVLQFREEANSAGTS